MAEIVFTPREEFVYAGSVYMPGLTYTARTEAMQAELAAWCDCDLVDVVKGVPAAVAGTGTVK